MSKLLITETDCCNYQFGRKQASTMLASMIANGALSRNVPVHFVMPRERALELAKLLDFPENRIHCDLGGQWSDDPGLLYRNGEWLVRTLITGTEPAFKSIAAVMAIYSR